MKPFVDPPAREPVAWAYCSRCAQSYDAALGHACDPLGFSSGVLVVVGALVFLAVGVLAGVQWWPW